MVTVVIFCCCLLFLVRCALLCDVCWYVLFVRVCCSLFAV